MASAQLIPLADLAKLRARILRTLKDCPIAVTKAEAYSVSDINKVIKEQILQKYPKWRDMSFEEVRDKLEYEFAVCFDVLVDEETQKKIFILAREWMTLIDPKQR